MLAWFGLTCQNGPMTESKRFILYSRPGCHLCERVEDMLRDNSSQWRVVNIEGDTGLEKLYGLKIPVVEDSRTINKLFFPFGEEQLTLFLVGGGDSET